MIAATARPIVAILTAFACLVGLTDSARAEFPDRPIKLVVPAGAGGGADISARLLGKKITESTGQPVVVENIGGAGGMIGADRVAKSAPDGYTVLFGINQLMTMVPALQNRMPYVESDFESVGMVYRGGFLLLASNEAPFRTFPELLAYAKAHPGAVAFASTGSGSSGHLGMELIQQRAGVSLLHVPFKSPGTVELMSNQVQLKLEPMPSGVPLVRSGRVKAIAFTGPQRAAGFPDLPTVAETLPGYELLGWQGIWVPKGTPRATIAKLNAEFVKALDSAEVRQHMSDVSALPNDASIPAMNAMQKTETARWRELVRDRQIKLD